MKKLLAILLAVVMVLGLAACDKGSDDEPTIVGTWKGSVDLGTALKIAAQKDIYVPLWLDIMYTFDADGTYSLTVDKDSVETMLDDLVDVMIEVMYDPDMDLEAAVAAEGMTMEEFRKQFMDSMGMDVDQVTTNLSTKGFYKYEDGKLYSTKDKESLDAGDYIEINYITLTAETMTITDAEQGGEKLSELVPDMLPIVCTKQ